MIQKYNANLLQCLPLCPCNTICWLLQDREWLCPIVGQVIQLKRTDIYRHDGTQCKFGEMNENSPHAGCCNFVCPKNGVHDFSIRGSMARWSVARIQQMAHIQDQATRLANMKLEFIQECTKM